tara:strand:+ start:230 stop:454 length:225 start_codon:yes stop_codon:yes gene_type:complete
MFRSLLDTASNTVSSFVENPISTTVDIVTQPIKDGCDVLHGLTEGELRTKAALRLGVDVVAGMAIGEVVEAMYD